jgi:N-acetylglucosaminyl-diphospho-decaprenol L-rhamnosyltransferase
MTDLWVSVVSHRTPALLRHCLESLAAQRAGVDLEVTVVDNDSGDGSAEMVETEFPWVHLIRNARNLGFGAAHNQTIRASSGKYVLLLNSDAAPGPGALRILVDALDLDPRRAVVGPKLRYPDGSVQPSRRRFPTSLTLFFESTQLQRVWPKNAILRRYFVADRSDDEPQEVDWLVGACLCVRRSAIDQIGLLDERFFMYSEELDWCRRFRLAGWRVAYVPSAEVMHLEGGSSRQDLAARDRRFQSSKLAYAAKWHGPAVSALLRSYLVLEYLARAAEESLKLMLGSRVDERRDRLRVISSGLRHALFGG